MSLSSLHDPVSKKTSFLRKLRWLRTTCCLSMAGKYGVLAASTGVSVALVLPVVVDVPFPVVLQAIAILAFALPVSIVLTALGAPSLAATARRTDREFRLQDRVATALEHVVSDDEMALLLLADAERRLPASWKGTEVWDFRRQIRASILVLAIPLAVAFSVRSIVDIRLPNGGGPSAGQAARSSDETESVGTAAGIVAVPSAAPLASLSEAGRPADEGSPAGSSEPRSGQASSGGLNAEFAPPSSVVPSDPDIAPTSTAGGVGRSDRSAGQPAPADVSTAGTSMRATAGQFEGMGAVGVGTSPSGVGAENPGSGASSAGGPSEQMSDFRSVLDPRRESGYSDSWRRAQAIPLSERIPAGFRRYIRDYFAAIEP